MTHYRLSKKMSFNNILLDSIATTFEITLTSSSPKVIEQNKNVSDKSVSSKNAYNQNRLYIKEI